MNNGLGIYYIHFLLALFNYHFAYHESHALSKCGTFVVSFFWQLKKLNSGAVEGTKPTNLGESEFEYSQKIKTVDNFLNNFGM